MKAKIYFSTLIFLVCTITNVYSQSTRYRAQGKGTINIGNINASFLGSGILFLNDRTSNFEVPKGSNKYTVFASGLDIAGRDQNNQIRASNSRYAQQNDFYEPGPIDSITKLPSSPSQWDHVWCIEKSKIESFIINFNNPSYIIPNEILTWPGNDVSNNNIKLAPFNDLNSNGIYEPRIGEYPLIKGDQYCFFINNDFKQLSVPLDKSLGIEIQTEIFAFDQVAPLGYALFIDYTIINRSNNTYSDFYLGQWSDLDIGNYQDDFIGTDVGRDMIFGYNGDNDDETTFGYGLNPPAQGIIFLNHPLVKSLSFANTISTGITDLTDEQIHNLLTGKWSDGTPQTFGGTGYDPASSNICSFTYPSNTDPAFPGQTWSEETESNIPQDRRIMGSVGPFVLPIGGKIKLSLAYLYARGTSGNSVAELKAAADIINP